MKPKIQILFQDDHLLIINKPADLLAIEDGYNQDLPHVRKMLEASFGKLWIVHRLDKETSGIMLLAKTAKAHQELNRIFRDREIEKYYHGLVTPVPDWREKHIHFPLRPNADRRHRTRVDTQRGKPAQSICHVRDVFSKGVLMEIEIKTGITHQIRSHLRMLDLILIGETLYNAGLPDPEITAPRMMLHAQRIHFIHPITSDNLTIQAPYPEDFRTCLTHLRLTRD